MDVVVQDLTLHIPKGKFFALLGPSGCGKTTLLRMIAGLEQPDEGQILVDHVDVSKMPIYDRPINTVFQNYALFPHYNVYDNIAYGLCVQKIARDEIEARVQAMLKMFHIEPLKYKKITQLSGGQQQRVAIARAVINEPKVLLLDEPLAALDLKLRERVLIELIEIQEKLDTTFVYVTHDQTEALTVADKMAIMNLNGQIEQVDTPKQIYEFPRSCFVANFVGTTNILQGSVGVADGEMKLCMNDRLCAQLPAIPSELVLHSDQNIFLTVRPEKIEISKKLLDGFSNCLTGTVVSIVYHGRSTQYNVKIATGQIIQAFEQNEEHFEKEIIDYDDRVYLYWQKENSVVLTR